MRTVEILLLVVALVLFLIAAFITYGGNEPTGGRLRINFIALGLAAWAGEQLYIVANQAG